LIIKVDLKKVDFLPLDGCGGPAELI
jgi:hypothetical protein